MEDIYNFLQISDSIATSGQPTKEQFPEIKKLGYQVVVNLALPTSPNALPGEKEIVEDLGMEYIHIPVVWENPTIEDLDRFFFAMSENKGKKTFVHCAANMRVSAFMYLYRRLRDRVNEEEAKQDLDRIWQPNETWQQFIKRGIEKYQ